MKPNSTVKGTTNSKNNKNTVRKSLYNLQPSATDKENLVGGGRMVGATPQSKSKKMKTKSVTPKRGKTVSPKSKKNTTKDKAIQTTRENIKIEIEDLTSLAGPSSNYWEVLAERRRLALEDTLEQNKEFSELNEKREEENEKLRELYDKRGEEIEKLQEKYEKLRQLYEKLREQYEKLGEANKKLLEENHLCKEMLDETNILVEVLREMTGDDKNEINNSLDDSVL